MWFKRPNRNRRLSPGRKLDVKLRSEQVRAARTWWAAKAVTVGVGTAFGLYLLWCSVGWGLDKFIYENPSFAIEQVDIHTDGTIPMQQLRRWSGVKPGANLIALDLAAVKRNLELVSTIDTVSLERILPRTLIIRVTERHAVAQANVYHSLPSGDTVATVFQLDANGHVMQAPDQRSSALPLDQLKSPLPGITGLNPCELQPGHLLASAQALAALRLIVAFEHSPMQGIVDFQSVDISAPGVLIVTSREGGEVTFAPEALDWQMLRWRAAYDKWRSFGRTIACMDLSVSNNVPVRSNPDSAGPDATPQSDKPLHSRRKNV